MITITGITNIKVVIMDTQTSSGISIITDEMVDRIAMQVERIKSIVERIENDRRHFNETRYYDIKMLTKRFNLSKSTIHTMVKRGILPAVSFGGKYIFLKEDIETMLKNYGDDTREQQCI